MCGRGTQTIGPRRRARGSTAPDPARRAASSAKRSSAPGRREAAPSKHCFHSAMHGLWNIPESSSTERTICPQGTRRPMLLRLCFPLKWAQKDLCRPDSSRPGAAGDPMGESARRATPAAVPDSAHVPPQNLEAEESVLGAMMLSPGAIGVVSEIVDAKDFY